MGLNIKDVKCKENISVNLVLTFCQFYVFQFISVQFNVFHVLKFDLQQAKSNLIPRKISYMRVTSKGAANLSEVKFLRNIHIYKITS